MSAAMTASVEPIPYRIRIGVTGHRSLHDSQSIEALVKQLLCTQFKSLFPPDAQAQVERMKRAGTTPVLYRVLSSLAEGADRVVARAVLSDPGARLEAVIPLAVEDYLATFESDEARSEFHALLAQSRKPVVMRARLLRDERSDPAAQAELRHQAYSRAGRFVVDHCDVLIAVWDGERARGVGGTAEIVQYALKQRRPVFRIWHGSVHLINAGNHLALDAGALMAVDQFNRQPLAPGYLKSLNRNYFEAARIARWIPESVRSMVNARLFPYYAKASDAAKVSQKRFYNAGKTIYALSAAAVGCAAVGVLFPVIAWLGFTAELMLLGIILLTLWQAERRHSREIWIENRFLAERIRCGIFMAICGVEPKPIDVLPFMGYSQTANDWTVRAFDEIWDRLPPLRGSVGQDWRQLRLYIRTVWIREQIKFHQIKTVKEGRAARHLALAGKIVLPTTLAAAALHLLLLAWQPAVAAAESVHLLHLGLHRGLAFVALLFPAVAASLAGMEAHREHRRLEKRSANMCRQLDRIGWEMKLAADPERFEALLQHLDEEVMLRETQDWLMLMRYVEIKAG